MATAKKKASAKKTPVKKTAAKKAPAKAAKPSKAVARRNDDGKPGADIVKPR